LAYDLEESVRPGIKETTIDKKGGKAMLLSDALPQTQQGGLPNARGTEHIEDPPLSGLQGLLKALALPIPSDKPPRPLRV